MNSSSHAPALAALALIYIDKIVGEMAGLGISPEQLSPTLQLELDTVRVLANGFIVTSLIWASALAALLDRNLRRAAIFFAA